jgi:hypothetical protein
MSDPLTPLPASIAFTATADEVTRFRWIAGRSVARAAPSGLYWIVLLGMFVVIGFAVLAAQKTDSISAEEVPPVLLAAFLSYGCGVLLSTLLARRFSRLAYAADGAAAYEVAFSDDGMQWKTDLVETRVRWQAVKSIEAWPECMLIWLGNKHFCGVPARMFPDDAARAAFITAVRQRIVNAH